MIPELGEYALIISLCLSVLLGTIPLVGASTGNGLWCGYARPLSVALFSFVLFSFLCLGWSFLQNDFSVAYVANNSNSALPWYYRLSAVWGGHEGSLLLWLLILAGWTVAVALKSRNLPDDILARVLAVMGLIATGFILFVLFTSSPFERLLPRIPEDGADLNPLLQDFGLIVHPPMLYMGYVGFSVAFAFAIAALLSGQLDAAWARWSRPWTSVAWAFLTLGIALGSWWAYYELGWGGWWFWDPVENASLMPWLIGTALVHSLAVTEKRGVFKSWTVLLAIFAFSLSLLGTFLVRSGVLTSVHAFASDPDRGFFILALLAVTIGGSLLLYAFKASEVKSESSFGLFSRESFLLINNVLLTVICAMVLLGTLYPLLIDALNLGKLSVGPPYFNALFIPLSLLLALSLGVGTLMRWKQTEGGSLAAQIWLPGLFATVLAGICIVMLPSLPGFYTSIALLMAWWIVFTGCRDLLNRVRHKSNPLAAALSQPRAYYGMMLAHGGVAVLIVGAALVSTYSEQSDLRMEPGDRKSFADYEFVFDGIQHVEGPNFTSDKGVIRVLYKGEPYTELHPEKRLYTARGNVMTEAAIDPGLFRDLYVALGEPLGGDAWAVRVQYKPFVRWLWLGGLLMTAGGILAAMDLRYRRQAQRELARSESMG
ncbi:heme lyase CcmF/NrfE family subunit [Marinobacterium litorale]|uniref:heme lyase CcmF/NrfE family subunit n=1 Tax=Marinobacterium litorale TaxID=404770 RepID=UPI000415E085|nr:heme lyase CcmF/NrfE family subunit [Marinobacterium litorale]